MLELANFKFDFILFLIDAFSCVIAIKAPSFRYL